MKCSEYIETLYDQFDAENYTRLSDLRQHAAECPACRSYHRAFEEILAVLKPGIQPKAPASIKSSILREIERSAHNVDPGKMIRTNSFWKKSIAVAAILILLLATPFLFRNGNGVAKASTLILNAIQAAEYIRNYTLLFSVRTDPNDDFESIDPNDSMVQHT